MKKLCLLVFGFVSLLPIVGRAGFLLNDSHVCAVDNDGEDWFWFCGSQSASCRGIKARNSNPQAWLGGADDYWWEPPKVEGKPSGYTDWEKRAFYWEGSYYACCGGRSGSEGELKSYSPSEWLKESKKTLTNGSCTYYTNPCGTSFIKNEDGSYTKDTCNLPTDCDEGFVMRVIDENTKRCVEACGAGEGYETADIDTCVSCSSGAGNGVDDIGTCVRCESDEFFVKPENGCLGSACCVKKNSRPVVSKVDLAACYRCPIDNVALWAKCATNKNGLNTDEKKECGIK